MRILVCGGRDYADQDTVFATLDNVVEIFGEITGVIHGAAKGADSLAGKWANDRNIAELKYPADWAKYGKRAGYLRNQEMLDKGKPDFVVAFPGGRGTAMMVDIATKAGVSVWEV